MPLKKLFLPLAALFGFLAVFALNLRVTRIDCRASFGPCPDAVNSDLHALLNSRLLFPVSSQFASQLAARHNLKSVHFSRLLPSTLIVSLEIIKPIGNLSSDLSLSETVIVGESGELLNRGHLAYLPTLLLHRQPPSNGKLEDGLLLALSLLGEIQIVCGKPVFGHVQGLMLSARCQNGPEIILDISQPPQAWSGSLQAILDRSKMTSNGIKKIDLRFSHPVITYANN